MNKPAKISCSLLPLLTCLCLSSAAIAEDSRQNKASTNNDSIETDSIETDSVQTNDIETQNVSMETEGSSSIEASIEADDTEDEPGMLTTMNQEAAEWADGQREEVKGKLGDWAHAMDDWFGESDPTKPASASLRIVLDTRWADDPIEGSQVSVTPRIRGRLKLPVLEKRLSLIIGDEDLDEERILTQGSKGSNSNNNQSYQEKTYDRKQTRDDNASIALRWSKIEEALGFDADIGIRSGDDVYLKLSADRDLYEQDQWKVSTHNYYRYGSDSEHTLKGELNFQYALDHNSFVNNNVNVRYRHEGDKEETDWSNELRQIHFFEKEKQLSYGVSAFGYFENSEPSLNSYGPTITYRQPFWRDWLYLQTELNYFNDKDKDKDHFLSGLLRLEALF